MPLRIVRWTALGLIVLMAAGLAALEVDPATENASTGIADVPTGIAIGGPFRLIHNKNRPVTEADYRGRWMLVFFGYTGCADECPLTLQKMATALQALGPLADRVAPLFITVDPTHDTPDRLASYLRNFGTRIVGLTGSIAQIAAVAKEYRVYYSPAEHEQSGADVVSHSTYLYLMNPSGKPDALFPGDVTAGRLTAALRVRLAARK